VYMKLNPKVIEFFIFIFCHNQNHEFLKFEELDSNLHLERIGQNFVFKCKNLRPHVLFQ